MSTSTSPDLAPDTAPPTETDPVLNPAIDRSLDKTRLVENLPFWAVHAVAAWGVWKVGFSTAGWIWLAVTYFVHMHAITGWYHRYFSHRTFKTSRAFGFLWALIGVTSVQKGPLWWAHHHRHHHKYSDQPEDIHSPRLRGFWWSHMFWILAKRYRNTDLERIKDFARYPELRWLDRYELVVVVAYAAVLYLVGGSVALFWGFFLSTVVSWHCTFFINSLAHVIGRRRYATTDDSKNSWLLAVLTLGEGWHNNHHYYQRATNQGFYWWEIDVSYYLLRLFQAVGLVWDVHPVPRHVRDQHASDGRARLAGAAPGAAVTEPTR
ncbi:MAG: acyl-CoA desaturase [Kofleriaceae bacterium]|jgi:stearoyl-CoA desaturase (delta-9 desaturase)|nr:acyl-CoA desaturase [Kofleriaceae bacterium]MBP6839318.1 acyl-CoA desaturase [Kofleriaceae bacterium]